MKKRTSVTIAAEVLSGIDRLAGANRSRSAIIEHILRCYLSEHAGARPQARDLEQLNRAANELNGEAEDVLDYQSF